MQTATWNSTTVANTTLQDSVDSASTAIITLNVTGTLTAGLINFEASPDGITWYPIIGLIQGTLTIFTNWQPFYGSSLALQFNIAGFSTYRCRLATALTGSGSVTILSNGVANACFTIVAAVVQQNGANLHVVVDSGNITAVDTPSTTSVSALLAKIISATGALTLVKGSTGNLYGMYFLNNTAVASWIQFFNAATTGAVTLGTTVPVWAAPIAANGILNITPGHFAQLNFSAGIVYAATSLLQGTVVESMSGTVEYL
jgi:hypothetical protein